MKNFKFNIGIVALLLGLSIAVTQSSFGYRTVEYGKHLGTWYNYNNPGSNLVSICDQDEQAICTGLFSSPPMSGTDEPDSYSTRLGNYSVEEIE